ncbi:MAG: diguanylate cyclase [Oscillospiraceae bacterium]|jgi:diguanylate cyclase (GGDEF)-like protein|nr:diguanylate cyclase [Oscillospiraceae bacterium]
MLEDGTRIFDELFTNGLLMGFYIILFAYLALSLFRMYVNRQNVRLPLHLTTIAGCVLLWSLVSVLRFVVGDGNVVYILSLVPYAFILFALTAVLFFLMRFHNLIAFCKPQILMICLLIPAITLLNIGLGMRNGFTGVNLIKTAPSVSIEHINYVYGEFGPWYYVQFTIIGLLVCSIFTTALIQHVRLPKIYRAPSEKLLVSTVLITLGFLVSLLNNSGGIESYPVDFMLIGFIFSIRFFYLATLGNQGLVFLSQARNNIIQHLDQSILILNEEQDIVFKNQKSAEWLNSLQFADTSYQSLIENLAAAAKKCEKLSDEEGGTDYHFDIKSEAKVFNLREKPILDKTKRQIGTYVVYSDVTENRLLIQRLEVGAGRDALTGLHNRSMMEQLKKELDTPEHLPLSVLICDLNDLKKTNDVHGHQAGDIMLRVCGEALSSEKIPPTAQAGRIGGDEFLLLLPQATRLEADAVSESVREYLQKIDDYPYKIVVSIGSGVKEKVNEDLNLIMQQADKAMYENKRMLKGGGAIRNTSTELI